MKLSVGGRFRVSYPRSFPHNFIGFSRIGECPLQISLNSGKLNSWAAFGSFYGMFFILKGYKTFSMKTTMKQTSPSEMYEGFHLMGTIVLVLLFLALVAGSFYMFVENYS